MRSALWGLGRFCKILGTLKKASAAASSGYWLGPPLIRASVRFSLIYGSPMPAAPILAPKWRRLHSIGQVNVGD